MIALALLLAAQWSALVTIAELQRGPAQVELTLPGLPDGETKICFGRQSAAEYASGLPKDPSDDACLLATSSAGVLTARYQLDLEAFCRRSRDPDDCSRGPSGIAMTDKALLALPRRGRASLSVRFVLPEGVEVAAPWDKQGGAKGRFLTTAGQIRDGSYLALGKLARLEDIKVEGGVFQLALFDLPRRSSLPGVRNWLLDPARAVGKFWRGLPGGRALLILQPVPDNGRGGIFGSVLHSGVSSAVLYFGADATDADLPGGWVAFHELFHAGQPSLATRSAWFIEGTATYYQDVLRARSGSRTSAEMWSDLGQSLVDHCAPEGGMSLEEESRELRRTHNYPHVYWMGACTAFRLDVRMRELSAGKRSLDDALVRLAALGKDRDLEVSEVLAELDKATAGLASELVHMTKDPRPIKDELLRLGVEMKGDTAVLHDDAPQAALRRAIF